MNLQPEIKTLAPKTLVGICRDMSMTKDETGLLWRNFMPQFKPLNGDQQHDLFSLQDYPENYFTSFAPDNTFTKWAAVELTNNIKIPPDFKQLDFTGGLYAMFHYKGLSSDKRIFQYIYTQWLPNSEYEIDNRPHYELLGEKYKNNDPTSEELIFIPIKK
ncbi:MAG: GyrI-like domain-containing protein [Fulvivirga sp.]